MRGTPKAHGPTAMEELPGSAGMKCYLELLAEFESEVQRYCLTAFLRPDWFAAVRRSILAWDETQILQLDDHTLFITYLQERDEGRSLPQQIRLTLDCLNAQSSKAARIRQRIQSMAGDFTQVAGAFFELCALYPLVTPPNELVDFEPIVPGSQRRAEALVKVAGHEVYIEATAFTRVARFFNADAPFWFDPDEVARHEAYVLNQKIAAKAEQLIGATRPVFLFVATGMALTDLALFEDPMEAAVTLFTASSPGRPISAIAFARNHLCEGLEIHEVPTADHPLPAVVADWIRQRARTGWRAPMPH